MSFRKKNIIVGAALALALVAGAAAALPANGWEITYYDGEGNIVGGSDYLCGPRIYNWGRVTPIYHRLDFSCSW